MGNNILLKWCAHFLLPKKVIKRVQTKCSAFLWKGTDDGARGTKVNWGQVCRSRKEGGLGVRDISQWNKVGILKYIYVCMATAIATAFEIALGCLDSQVSYPWTLLLDSKSAGWLLLGLA